MTTTQANRLHFCQRCGRPIEEKWDSAGRFCGECGLERELFDRENRRDTYVEMGVRVRVDGEQR